jgi:hypothetical protein
MHQGNEKCIQNSGSKTPREENHLEDLGVDQGIILK